MLPRTQAASARHAWFEHQWRRQRGPTFGTAAHRQLQQQSPRLATDVKVNSMEKDEDGIVGKMTDATSAVSEEKVVVEGKTEKEPDEALPKLSPKEFKAYNRMAEHMEYFHNHFRQTWTTMQTACSANKRPQGMSIRSFLSLGEQFAAHLTMHHTIEERHIFPVLARKMPAFRQELDLLSQHKQIHEGLMQFERYLAEVRRGERELVLAELGRIMDGFGGVLWRHLDEEVKELGAENMRKFWTVDEMRRMPM